VVEQLDRALSGADSAAPVSTPERLSIGELPREETIVGGAPAAQPSPLASLSVAHGALAQIIAPATPGAVLLLADARATPPLLYALGPLPIARQMLGLAVLSLFMLLGIALSQSANALNMSKTLPPLSPH